MSKTVSTCILETNQVLNQPQENLFFHTIYRTQADYPNEFLRTARSTSPIQICALFSCIGPDNLGAVLNIELNEELTKIVAACQNQPVLDFEAFSNQVINVLNVKVCGFSVSRGGKSLKVSMTMIVIEGDTLRVIHVGNTKAVLVRDNRIMALTEEHTVAHNYVKANAITPEQEKTHPENMNLTQYLGKMPQEGPVVADKRIRLKLKDNDEICIMGLGVSRLMPAQTRNSILVKPGSTESKTRDIINSAFNYGVKSGLSICLVQIESTFLLPGDAAIKSNLATDATVATAKKVEEDKPYTQLNEPEGDIDDDFDNSQTQKFTASNNDYDEVDSVKDKSSKGKKAKKSNESKKSSKVKDILVPIIILLVCIGIGYGGMYLVFNAKHLLDKVTNETLPELSIHDSIMYALNDNTPVYASASLDASSIGILSRGQAVDVLGTEGDFTNVSSNGVTGYVLSVQLSTDDPTLIDSMTDNAEGDEYSDSGDAYVDDGSADTYVEETAAETYVEETAAATEAYVEETAAATEAYVEETVATEAPTEAVVTEAETVATEAEVTEEVAPGGSADAGAGEEAPVDDGSTEA